jgi:hypothetical protein
MEIENLIRKEDGYINATQICKAGGKEFKHWNSLESTKKIINILSKELNIKILDIKKGGNDKKNQGSWVHPLLATYLAQWISLEFSVKVSKWIEEWKNIKTKNQDEYNDSLKNITPDKFKTEKEKEIQLKLHKIYGGEIEAETEFGFIDLLTDTEIIEIKVGYNWKHGLGQLCVYSETFTKHKKRLHLFDIEYNEKINNICSKYDITVSYE